MPKILPRRVLSGIQPTGVPHLGNYLGAIRRWARESNESNNNNNSVSSGNNGSSDVSDAERSRLFSIVDLHAMTIPRPASELLSGTRDTAAALIACGVIGGSDSMGNPNRSATLFVQSEVPSHAELTWVLSCASPTTWLSNMTQFKEKKKLLSSKKAAKGESKEAGELLKVPSVGLYSYPLLMAADILVYRATHVPVGEDQAQHLELARKVCARFNNLVQDDVLVAPISEFEGGSNGEDSEPSFVNPALLRVKSLRDGTKKMSKSDPVAAGRIDLDDTADAIAKKVRRAKTDTLEGITFDPENRPDVANLLGILAAIENEDPRVLAGRFPEGAQMSQLKNEVAEALVETISPISDEIARHRKDWSEVDAVLDRGAQIAREIAADTMADVWAAVGAGRHPRV